MRVQPPLGTQRVGSSDSRETGLTLVQGRDIDMPALETPPARPAERSGSLPHPMQLAQASVACAEAIRRWQRSCCLRRRKYSASVRHKQYLQDLTFVLEQSEPCFIRCVKPNNGKTPGLFHGPAVMRQLACANVLETITICR